MAHKAGFVNILGNPNVGKSTIMNALVGERLSVITSKAQTTRHRILGIVNTSDYQLIYSDTPGILNPQYEMQKTMMKSVKTALIDADIILYVTDVVEKPDKNLQYLNKVGNTDVPVLLLINKIDITNQEKLEALVAIWKNLLPGAEIIPLSAKENFHLDYLLKRILHFLPENPPYYPKDQLTDRAEKFFVSEIIRGSIFEKYRQEIPYSIEIQVESYKEEENIIKIRSVINVLRNSQKGIIIGHKGESLKAVGIESRKEIESFLGKKVYLELFVKVNKDWRDTPGKLKQFGY